MGGYGESKRGVEEKAEGRVATGGFLAIISIMRFIFFCLACVVLLWVVRLPFQPINHPAGVLAPRDPVQGVLLENEPVILVNGWNLTPLATYSVQARVLAVKHYRSDPTSVLSPYDAVLGWGPMSDSATLSSIRFSQRNRFGFWHHGPNPPISSTDISQYQANTHLIPATPEIESKMGGLRVGSVVYLRGKLVEARRADGVGPPWRSSLTRDDSGDGACEILYVESLAVR